MLKESNDSSLSISQWEHRTVVQRRSSIHDETSIENTQEFNVIMISDWYYKTPDTKYFDLSQIFIPLQTIVIISKCFVPRY